MSLGIILGGLSKGKEVGPELARDLSEHRILGTFKIRTDSSVLPETRTYIFILRCPLGHSVMKKSVLFRSWRCHYCEPFSTFYSQQGVLGWREFLCKAPFERASLTSLKGTYGL